MKYVINYNTGVKHEVEAEDLNEVKEIAKEGIEYTQENITIETLDGNILTTSFWHGVNLEEDHNEDEILEKIGSFGYYAAWTE